MNEDFQSAVRRLFEELRLGAPRFSEPGRLRLQVEEIGLDLFDDGLGSLVVEAVAGRFSSDPLEQVRQRRHVLETNLGLLLDQEATVRSKPAVGGDVFLTVGASQALRGLRVDQLVKKIEDVIRTVEYYAPQLKVSGQPKTATRVPTMEPVESAIIFRP